MARLDGQRVVIKGVFGITGGILRQKYTDPETLVDVRSLSLAIFPVMTIVSAVSFYALLVKHRARFAAQGLSGPGLVATGWYYWP